MFIALIILAVWLVINWLISEEFYTVACNKGFEERKYFLYCFLFGIVGYLLVIALPTLDDEEKSKCISGINTNFINSGYSYSESRVQRSEHKTTAAQGYWKCKKCGHDVPNYTGTCACGQSKDAN